MAQAYQTRDRLKEAYPELQADGAVEICIIKTTGADYRVCISMSVRTLLEKVLISTLLGVTAAAEYCQTSNISLS